MPGLFILLRYFIDRSKHIAPKILDSTNTRLYSSRSIFAAKVPYKIKRSTITVAIVPLSVGLTLIYFLGIQYMGVNTPNNVIQQLNPHIIFPFNIRVSQQLNQNQTLQQQRRAQRQLHYSCYQFEAKCQRCFGLQQYLHLSQLLMLIHSYRQLS